MHSIAAELGLADPVRSEVVVRPDVDWGAGIVFGSACGRFSNRRRVFVLLPRTSSTKGNLGHSLGNSLGLVGVDSSVMDFSTWGG